MSFNKLYVWAVFMAAILLLGACSSQIDENKHSISAIKQKGVLKVGVFSDKPPFGFVNEQGEYDGFDIHIAKRLAHDLLGDKGKIEFIPVEAASRVEFLKSEKVDIIMANFTKTPEREEVVDFSVPYMKVSLGVVSKNGEIKDIQELEGKTLIVNKGTTADFYFSKKYPNIELQKYDQNTEAFLSLKAAKGAALAHDNTLLFAWVKENPDYIVAISSLGDEEVIAPAIKKGNKELLDWLDSEIKTLIHNGFIKQVYENTLSPVYGDGIDPKSVIFED